MTVKTLADLKKDFIQTYYTVSSGKVLLDLIFTDYKNSPSELKEIPALEVLAKQRVSQIADAAGVQVQVVEDLLNIVQDIIVISQEELDAIKEEIVAAQAEATTVDPIEGTTGAPSSGPSGDGGGGDGGGGG
jgi:hypothetical protein